MEEFRNMVRAVCVISGGICIMEYFVSGTKFRNQIKTLLNLMLAIVILIPFVKNRDNFEFPDFKSINSYIDNDAEILYDEVFRRKTEENISSVLFQQITANGYSCENIETEVNILSDGSISIIKVMIETDDFNGACDVIRESLGQETEVINGIS